MPVFITMYQVVRIHEETFPSFASGGILWFTDLTEADPYFVLPVLSALILVAAGEVSARNVDPQQRRLMRLLPVAFTAFIARFPAGLLVYWVTSNAVTLIQNLLIYRREPSRRLPRSSEETRTGSTQNSVESPTANGPGSAKSRPRPRAKKAESARRRKRKKRR
jgi:YidC/Oxa1 family membrane protein insertase